MATMTADQVLQRYRDEALPEFVELQLRDVNQVGNFGNTPLHVAAVRGDLEELEALLAAGANPGARGELGNTPLHEAVGQGHRAIAERLLKAGADRHVANDNGLTPLQLAEMFGRADIVR
jgi:ankyrin repeat protein